MIPLPSATYDPEARRLYGPNGGATLSSSQHALLMCLAERRGKLVQRDTLIGALWDPDDEPEEAHSALRVHITHLRRKLRAVGAGSPIATVWGAGFVLRGSP